jgi:hypothetical protein
MLRVWLVLLFLALGARDGDAGRQAWRGRPTGSKYGASRRAQRRNHIHERWQELVIRRAPGTPRLSSDRIARGVARIAKARPDVSAAKLAAGFVRYQTVIGRVRAAGGAHPDAVRVTRGGRADGLTIPRVDLLPPPGAAPQRPRVLVVGGVHAGHEPVGVEAALRFIESTAKDPALRAAFDITVLPLLAPSSLVLADRENTAGLNVNRTFADGKWTAEAAVVRDIMATEQFDIVLDLHGAGDPGRNGFFVIGQGRDDGMGARILSAMESASLMDVRGAAGAPAVIGPYSLTHLGDAISSNPDTLTDHADRRGARYSYTLEAPTRLDGERQVRGMLKLVHSALHNVRRHGDWRR